MTELLPRSGVEPGIQTLVRGKRAIHPKAGTRTMLVLSRKKDEKIVIGDNISIMVVEIRGDKVRLGIEAPREISVHRREVYEAIKRKEAEAPEATEVPQGTDTSTPESVQP